jgi:IclR family acetate operon transcriptional repressor
MFHNVETRLFLSVIRPRRVGCKNPPVSDASPSTDDAPGAPRSGTQSVERAIAVLECFAGADRSLGLTEIARAVALTPSTVHRLLRALIGAGYVEQEPTTEHYRLGIGIAVLGQRALEHSGYHLARPVLDQLSARTGESVSLGIRRGHEVVVIERASGAAPLRFDHPAGAEIAMHSSAMGKVLLAFSPGPIVDGVTELLPLQRFTECTHTTVSELTAELERVLELGYATNIEERHAGVCGVAAPVRARSGIAHAAVGLQGPSVRLTPERLAELAPTVSAAAGEIAALVIRI